MMEVARIHGHDHCASEACAKELSALNRELGILQDRTADGDEVVDIIFRAYYVYNMLGHVRPQTYTLNC